MSVVKILSEEEVAERRQRMKLDPLADELYNAGARLREQHQHPAALTLFLRGLAISPEASIMHNAVAAVLFNMSRYEEALPYAERALELDPDDAATHNNIGMVTSALGDMERSLVHHRRALELNPEFLHGRWSLAQTLLRAGDWEQGFREYECRAAFKGPKFYPPTPYPLWQGEDLAGKTIMVLPEQGSGDRILFSRYLHWLKQTWPTCHIIYMDTVETDTLLWEFRHFVEFIPNQVPWPEGVDYYVHLMSLPMHHGTRPDHVYPDPGLIAARVADEDPEIQSPRMPGALKVGIAWTGNPQMAQNMQRTIPLHELATLERSPEIQLYSLQQDNNEIAALGYTQGIKDLAPEIRWRGYVGTAAAMKGLDVIVTACTSVAHLAGALGVPCHVLLCSDPYWLWQRSGQTTPWYPSVRLHRQTKPMDWRPVIEEVRRDLVELARSRQDLRKTA